MALKSFTHDCLNGASRTVGPACIYAAYACSRVTVLIQLVQIFGP